MVNTKQQYQYSDPDFGGRRDQPTVAQQEGKVGSFNRSVMQFLSDRPAVAFFGALTVGFLVGRLFARK